MVGPQDGPDRFRRARRSRSCVAARGALPVTRRFSRRVLALSLGASVLVGLGAPAGQPVGGRHLPVVVSLHAAAR